MCRVTVGETAADEALQRLQEELEQLQLQQSGQCSLPDFRGIPGCKGSGPRLFCGHVPKEATEDLVRAHFSRWGTVTDVYFPRHKKTLKRRPFCFVTFVSIEAADRALAESPLNICGIPIKNLTMVEDRDAYYRTKHANTRAALLQALQSIGNSANGQLGPDQLNNLAALLAMEGVTAEAVMGLLPQQGNGLSGFNTAGLQMDTLLGGTSGLPNMAMNAFSASPPSAGLYDGYNAQMAAAAAAAAQRQMAPPAPTFQQSNGRYGAGSAGFGTPSGLPLASQLQQALLASRMQMAQAPQPPMSAAMLQQFGGLGGMPQFMPQPQYAPAPAMNGMPQPAFMNGNMAAAGWGLAGQQALPSSAAPAALLPPGIHLGPHSLAGSRSSGSGSPQEVMAAPQISLDEALAALSKLKSAQQGPLAEMAARHPAPPSAEILAGLGSAASTFTGSLTGSPNLGTSPPSDNGGLLGSCNTSAELPPAGLWPMEGRRSN